MITEFQNDLKRLLIDPRDLFHVHVRTRIGKKATDNLERKIKEFILHMPSIVSRIDAMLEDMKKDSLAYRLAEHVLMYLYDPVDFLPEKDSGLFGYLDDAYFVATVYLIILEKIDPSLKAEEDRKLKERLSAILGPVRYIIPDEAKKIEKTISDIQTNQILCYTANS